MKNLLCFKGHMFIIILFENAQGVDFQPCRAQNFACWNNATSCWFYLEMVVLDLPMEEKEKTRNLFRKSQNWKLTKKFTKLVREQQN